MDQPALKNVVRGLLGLALTALAAWLTNYIVERLFGPEEPTSRI